DGRWFYTFDFEKGRADFVERTTGARDMVESRSFTLGNGEWRPGHDEMWFQIVQDGAYTVLIKTPGGSAVEVPGSAAGPFNDLGYSSVFTRDGANWFTNRASPVERPVFQVGSADDPTGARFDLAPPGATVDRYWHLADGRILAPASIYTVYRNDLYVVDPTNGKSGVLGEAGLVMTVGQTRLLASLHVNDGHGDLTAIELASGRAT